MKISFVVIKQARYSQIEIPSLNLQYRRKLLRASLLLRMVNLSKKTSHYLFLALMD